MQSGRCLEVIGPWQNPGDPADQDLTRTEIWDCTQAGKQIWTVIPLGDHKFSLKNQQSGKRLDVYNGDPGNGIALTQFRCHGGASEQFVFPKGDNGSFAMQSVLTSRFTDVLLHGVDNGVTVGIYDRNNQSNQQWTAVQLTTA